MAFRERFPTVEDLFRGSPEDVGAELVFYLQERSSTTAEGNIPGYLAHLYQLRGTDFPLLILVAEAIAWAKRALLVVSDLSQPPGWIALSRAGESFTRETLNQVRLRDLLPDFMLHSAVRAICLDIFNTGHYEAAVFEAFKTVEIPIREAAGLPEPEHGRPMAAKAFKAEGGLLTDPSEHLPERGALQMFASGAVGYSRTRGTTGARISTMHRRRPRC
jgi:hypothetical protein